LLVLEVEILKKVKNIISGKYILKKKQFIIAYSKINLNIVALRNLCHISRV